MLNLFQSIFVLCFITVLVWEIVEINNILAFVFNGSSTVPQQAFSQQALPRGHLPNGEMIFSEMDISLKWHFL